MDEQRYILEEAARELGVSKSTLVHWIARDGLREIVDKQVVPTDLRAHYLTRSQLETMARAHRRWLQQDYHDIKHAAWENPTALLDMKSKARELLQYLREYKSELSEKQLSLLNILEELEEK